MKNKLLSVILCLCILPGVITIATADQYDAHKPDYKALRWDIKINAFTTGTTIVHLSSSVLTSNLSQIFSVASRDGLTLSPSGQVLATDHGARGQTALSDAVSAIGLTERLLAIGPGTWAISSDLTIPANITIMPSRGAILQVAEGAKLTIHGPIQAGPWQVFSDNNTDYDGVVLGAAIKQAIPEWFGAAGDGSTDDTGPFKSLINAVATNGIPIDFAPGKTYLTQAIPYTHNNLVINGNNSTWKSTAAGYTLCSNTTEFTTLTYYDLTGNPHIGDMSITLADTVEAAYFSPGQFIYVRTGQTIADPAMAPHSQPVAEIAKIASIDGATLTLEWPLTKNYTGPIRFESGGPATINPGDTIAGAISGITATVTSVTLLSGSWVGGDAVGELFVSSQTGTFTAENLNVSGKQDNIATLAHQYPHGVANANNVIIQNTHLKNIHFEHYNGRPVNLLNQYNCKVEECTFDTIRPYWSEVLT